ncbi:uncharacterized protein [Phaenicophaeus curvirostris]|uniref:uncharacterized protein isoform X5 n=1 Tax=Phaenicophaeus curvirostris TaxID=33595 RepID=UPI0037F0EF34
MMREPLRDPDPSPGRGGKRRGGALQASSVQSTMEPSHLSCTLAAEEEEGAHGETEAIAIQQREPGRSVGDERAPAGSRPLPRERGEATWRCPPGQQRLAALKRGSQSQPRKRQRQLCQAGWVSKLYKRGCGSGMISVKSTTSKRASRLPGGSLQCPRQRAHLQTGASCLLRTDDPPQSHSPAASFTLVKTASVCFLLALIAVFTGSCGKPGARINTAA